MVAPELFIFWDALDSLDLGMNIARWRRQVNGWWCAYNNCIPLMGMQESTSDDETVMLIMSYPAEAE
jgi:hypothetical protein